MSTVNRLCADATISQVLGNQLSYYRRYSTRRAMNRKLKAQLIAPCGMNCAVCSAYIAQRLDLKKKGIRRTYCVGCRPRGQNCTFMGHICRKVGEGSVQYCYECPDFPCPRLKRLDKRYRKYNVSMIDNLNFVKEQGMDKFLAKEAEKWRCPKCGDVICCHTQACYNCLPKPSKHKGKKIPPEKGFPDRVG